MRLASPAGILVLALAPAAPADEKPNTLTPKEVADGWLLLFDGETNFGWKVDGAAGVKDGALVFEKGKKTTAYPTTGFGAGFEYKVAVRGAGRVSSPRGFSEFAAGGPGGWGEVVYSQNGRGTSGAAATPGSSRSSIGTPDARAELATAPFVIESDGAAELAVRSVKLRPLGATPLFNGKDLTGWKVFAGDPKRAATKFTVTAGGELSAKNGPGDLQTEGRWADFVLQLECKTNGKWLNSGVFFRCLPDQYQQGYEAQIHNGYLLDRTKPADYGTGAIYRRVAARKVVSDDNEWFTLSLVANGPRLATWVNGYQTVDWTDGRGPAENARQGLKTGKGHLSIQGHDPTTDLLFRNIRLAELPQK